MECPHCSDRLGTVEYYSLHSPRSRAYRAVAARGLWSAELAAATGLERGHITAALRGDRSFQPVLWEDLAHRFGDDWANQIRYMAFIDRRTKRGKSIERPADSCLLILWNVGLTAGQLAWLCNKPQDQVYFELSGPGRPALWLRKKVLQLAGPMVLKNLVVAGDDRWF